MSQLKQIYIPIWLDLLLFEMTLPNAFATQFTFQYGQIYYAEAFPIFPK